MRAVLVARVSSFRQAGNVSADVQLEACRAYIDSQDGEVVQEFFDSVPGTEGRYDERKGLHEALRQIETGKADTLVIYDISRAARDDVVFARLLKETYEVGGKLAIAVERQVYKTKGEAEVLLHWTKAASVYEILTLKRRTQSAKRRTLESGGFLWKPLTGYKLVKKDRIKVLAVDTAVAPYIEEVFSRLLENNTKKEIVDWLHTQGLDWDVRKVTQLIKDVSLYAGGSRDYTVTLEGEKLTTTVQFPALITRELALKIEGLPKATYRSKNNPTPYLGVVKCTNCGSGVYIARKYKGKVQLGCKSHANAIYHKGKGREAPDSCTHSVSEVFITKALLAELDKTIAELAETVEKMDKTIDILSSTDNSEKLEEIRAKRNTILQTLLNQKDLEAIAKVLNQELEKLDKEEEELKRKNKEGNILRENIIAARNNYADMDWSEFSGNIKQAIENKEWKKVNRMLSSINLKIWAEFKEPNVRDSIHLSFV